ncbi:unnamed protein product [Euphydryas editha]|uniref:Uncharacterized protein n=1 Tax=Euphydryas editha TaxID=104508 RepID=A0AAU9URW3_EUPED|nr:unnamed protein product [Euphydryas editha]
MPKRKMFEELSKSQKNKSLRQFQIESENLLDASTSKTCEISGSNCNVANNKNVTDNNNSSCSILDNINNSEINNPIDNNDIDNINDNDIEMNHPINNNDIDDNNKISDISDDTRYRHGFPVSN